MRCFSKDEILKQDALNLAWIVMSRSDEKSSVYEKAEKFWVKYADESIVADRPVKAVYK